jgi:ferrochelatase
MKTGILLINLGTPDAPRTPEVRRYLKQFLSDERVIDIHPLLRWLLLNLIILPIRSPKSAKVYASIWTEEGSPLLVHGKNLRSVLQERFGETPVELAMRYGSPSIEHGMASLRQHECDRVVVVPLFPQYASSSSGSAIQAAYEEASRHWNTPHLTIVPPFFDHPGFLEAFHEVARPIFQEPPEYVLFSFHGVPERHVRKSDDTGCWCLTQPECCSTLRAENRNCYSAQCYRTAQQLAAKLELPPEQWSVAFQSRLGRDPWLKPYTDQVIRELAQSGTTRLAVFCPAFVADCLETIEEIGEEAQETFREAGGETLHLIPSLNAHPAWVSGLEQIIRESLPAAKG